MRRDLGDGLSALERPAEGETVFWVHGYTTNATLWAELWDHLPGWRHVGLDLPGHGESRPFGADERLDGLAQVLAQAAIDLGARHLIGLSLGTIVALEMVLQRPGAFASLTLGAPALGAGPSDDGARQRFQQLEAAHALLGTGPWLRAMWMTSPPDIFRYAVRRPDLRRRLEDVIDAHSWHELASGRSITRVASEPQDVHRLAVADIDVLVVVGEHELECYRTTAEIIASVTPRARVEVLDDVGHACLVEAPIRCAELIHAHLQVRRTPSPG